MKKILFLFAMILLTGQLPAQYVWYFGNNAGLQFNGNPNPDPIAGSDMQTAEGSTVVTDKDGHVMFYSDGDSLWDGNNNFIPIPGGTGLLPGSSSATHAALAVPVPGSDCSRFLLFTTKGCDNPPQQICPLGVCLISVTNSTYPYIIVPGTAEKLVIAGNSDKYSEKLAVTFDGTGKGFWLMAHDCDFATMPMPARTFYAFHITENDFVGVTTTSQAATVLTNIVQLQTDPSWENHSGWYDNLMIPNSQGQMKFDKSGTKLGLVLCGSKYWENYDFNTTTGILTRKIVQSLPVDSTGTLYGCEFSPDGNMFYTSEDVVWDPDIATIREIKQWDVTGGTLNGVYSIPGTQQGSIRHAWGQLQLGPDDRIYCTGPMGFSPYTTTSLSVIPNPNDLGNCGWSQGSIPLPSGTTAIAGLPTLIKNIDGCDVIDPGCDSILLNTGYDHAHEILFDTSTAVMTVMDPYWQVVGLPPSMGLNFPSPSFVINDLDDYNTLNNSEAISFQPTNNLNINNRRPDPYIVFERCFTIHNEDILILTGSFMFDDAVCMTIDNYINVPINYIPQCTRPFDCDSACPNTNVYRFYASAVNFTTPPLAPGVHTIQLNVRNLFGKYCSVKFEGSIKSASKPDNFDCLPCKNSTLAIQKFDDVNCNGLLDTGDTTLPGWTFDISTALTSGSITTDANGIAYYPIEPSSTGSITVSETTELASNPGYQFVSTSFGTVISPGVFSFELNDSVLYNIAVLNKKCAVNPCDSVDAKLTKIETGGCCYKLEILNNYEPDYFTGVSITAGNLSISSITIDPLTCPWAEVSYQSPTQVILTSNYLYNGIPEDLPGMFQTLGTICFTGTGPDNITIDFIIGNAPGYDIICSKILTIEACDIPIETDCVGILDLKTECVAGVPRMKFKIHNYSDFTIRGLTLYSQNPDVIPDPQFVPVIPDLLPGQTSTSYFEVALIVSNNATNACFFFAACDQNIMPGTQGQYPLYCCMDSILYCTDIPPCNPCGGMIIAAQSDTNSNNCCYDLTLLADYYDGNIKFLEFTGVGGTQFSYYTGWDIILNESSHHLLIQAPGGSIPPGIYPDFVSICLYGSSVAPFTILVNIIDDQDRQCTDTLEFYCEPVPPNCASIINDSLYCVGTEIKYTFSVRNNSPFVIYHLDFRTNDGIVVQPQYIEPNPPIALGAVGGPYTIALDSIDENLEMFCIYLSAHNNIYDPLNGIYATECCTDSLSVVCLPLIDCVPCACCGFDRFLIPNGITPNGDGKNDVFLITNSEDCDFSIIVYNRWGNIVYEDGHYQNNWEGENENGEKLPQGTYYILIELANGSKKSTYIDIRY
jgi:gliding motility-associated-like protein